MEKERLQQLVEDLTKNRDNKTMSQAYGVNITEKRRNDFILALAMIFLKGKRVDVAIAAANEAEDFREFAYLLYMGVKSIEELESLFEENSLSENKVFNLLQAININ